jgi:hypothetical protein
VRALAVAPDGILSPVIAHKFLADDERRRPKDLQLLGDRSIALRQLLQHRLRLL